MGGMFECPAAFAPFGEVVRWTQDKAPHLTASFRATVLHGESQSETAGPSRGGFAADSFTVLVESRDAFACASGDSTSPRAVQQTRAPAARFPTAPAPALGDTLVLGDGTVLSVQQVSRDASLGLVIRCTANARAPK